MSTEGSIYCTVSTEGSIYCIVSTEVNIYCTVPTEGSIYCTVSTEVNIYCTVSTEGSIYFTVPTEGSIYCTVPTEGSICCTVPTEGSIYCTHILVYEFTCLSCRHIKEVVAFNKACVCILVRSVHKVMKTLQVFREVSLWVALIFLISSSQNIGRIIWCLCAFM